MIFLLVCKAISPKNTKIDGMMVPAKAKKEMNFNMIDFMIVQFLEKH